MCAYPDITTNVRGRDALCIELNVETSNLHMYLLMYELMIRKYSWNYTYFINGQDLELWLWLSYLILTFLINFFILSPFNYMSFSHNLDFDSIRAYLLHLAFEAFHDIHKKLLIHPYYSCVFENLRHFGTLRILKYPQVMIIIERGDQFRLCYTELVYAFSLLDNVNQHAAYTNKSYKLIWSVICDKCFKAIT